VKTGGERGGVEEIASYNAERGGNTLKGNMNVYELREWRRTHVVLRMWGTASGVDQIKGGRIEGRGGRGWKRVRRRTFKLGAILANNELARIEKIYSDCYQGGKNNATKLLRTVRKYTKAGRKKKDFSSSGGSNYAAEGSRNRRMGQSEKKEWLKIHSQRRKKRTKGS